jgi:outer membrane murein-binding lipoprotein Lpp
MTQSRDHETRIARLEVRMEEVAADAAAARHLAAANDRDYADLTVKVDAHRRAINALGEQTRARFDRLETRVDGLEAEMRAGHDELRAVMRHGFDQTAAGFARIAALIEARDDDR